MNWVFVFTASVAAACATLAAVHLSVWMRDRRLAAHAAFAGLASGVSAFTWTCLLMMQASSIDQFAHALWWANVTIMWMVAAFVAFIRVYFAARRMWIGYAAITLRGAAMLAHAIRWPASDFDVIIRLQTVDILGAPVSVAVGSQSIWFVVGQVSLVVLLIFALDAAVSTWRLGGDENRRRAIVIGGATAIFVGGGAASAGLILAGAVAAPHAEFIGFLLLLMAMANELAGDVARMVHVSETLRARDAALVESERRMTLAAEAARLGLWIWQLSTDVVWLTPLCRELLGLPAAGEVSHRMLLERVHPGDRERVQEELRNARATGVTPPTEYRVVHPDGSTRWITARLAADLGEDGLPFRMRGVCIDISDHREAEQTARALSGRLIHAQEDERRRLARDLHDDFNQRLALLSVDLELLGRQPRGAASGFSHIAAQVRDLSAEVHKLSYQLHPAKLDQLGLETASRSWCRDVAAQSGLQIEFVAQGVPRDLPPNISLCCYRIAQEALRNAVRHSGASTVRVELAVVDGSLRLTIADDGRGFDMRADSHVAGLGLLSMRERAQLVGGCVLLHSEPGSGTAVIASVPVPAMIAVEQ